MINLPVSRSSSAQRNLDTQKLPDRPTQQRYHLSYFFMNTGRDIKMHKGDVIGYLQQTLRHHKLSAYAR